MGYRKGALDVLAGTASLYNNTLREIISVTSKRRDQRAEVRITYVTYTYGRTYVRRTERIDVRLGKQVESTGI